jgi:hypothetical protein
VRADGFFAETGFLGPPGFPRALPGDPKRPPKSTGRGPRDSQGGPGALEEPSGNFSDFWSILAPGSQPGGGGPQGSPGQLSGTSTTKRCRVKGLLPFKGLNGP